MVHTVWPVLSQDVVSLAEQGEVGVGGGVGAGAALGVETGTI